MKKGILGCLGVLVALVMVGGGASYVFFVKPASDYIGSFTQFAELNAMNQEVENRAPYDPPADDELTAEQVRRLLAVQETVEGEMGQRLDALKTKYESMEADMQLEGREANYREVIGAWRDIVDLVLEAKRIHVDALNAHAFSLAEYRWVRDRVYEAAGVMLPASSLTDIAEAVRESGGDPQAVKQQYEAGLAEVPARNRELVEPHAEALEERAWLAWIGF